MINKKLKKYFLVFSLLLLVFFVSPVNNVYGDEPDNEGKIVDSYTEKLAESADPADKGGGDLVAGFLAWVTLLIATLFGKLLTLTTGYVNDLFQVNNFEVNGVKQGWIIVRDICNMSFILVLLLIAFATILRLENYSMKKYLPKLLIMAVMINFSKSICLFLIDISQIVMLTFSNAFAGSTSNFVTMLHIEKLMSISSAAKFSDMPWEMFWAAGLALIFILIAFFVMIMMLGLLIMRMVYFWILIILSPIAFLSTAVPGMSKYWGQWWGEFTKYLMVGPVLAFFTWLALTVASSNVINIFSKLNVVNGNVTGYSAFMNAIEAEGAIMPFILGIGLLLGAIKISKDMGDAGMSFGMNMANKAKSGTMGFGKGVSNRFTSKVGEVSGISGAREYLKQRKTYREDLRASKIQNQAGKIASGMQFTKENTVGWAGTKINKGWRSVVGGKKADELRKKAGEDKQTLSDINNGAGPGYVNTKKTINDTLKKVAPQTTIKKGDNTYKRVKGNSWQRIDKDGKVKDFDEKDVEAEFLAAEKNELSAKIEQNNKQADRLAQRQKWMDKAARTGLMVGGGALAYGTGGLLSGVGAGMAGAAYSWGDIKDAGAEDKKLASSYRMNKINKERDGKKNDSDEKLFTTADDRTINAFERAAAAMELMSRKKLSAEQVHEYRKDLQKDLGGFEMKDDANYWKDKKLNSQFELLAGNIQGASLTHLKAQAGDERAKFEIEQGYAGGHVNMKDMSIDMINKSIGEFAKGFKDDRFKKDFHDLSESMQNAFVKALEKNGSYEAKAKLAWVTDIKKAFGEGTAKTNAEIGKFIKSLSEEDINGIISKGTDQQINALINVVEKDPTVLSESVVRNQGSRAKGSRQSLGINV